MEALSQEPSLGSGHSVQEVNERARSLGASFVRDSPKQGRRRIQRIHNVSPYTFLGPRGPDQLSVARGGALGALYH